MPEKTKTATADTILDEYKTSLGELSQFLETRRGRDEEEMEHLTSYLKRLQDLRAADVRLAEIDRELALMNKFKGLLKENQDLAEKVKKMNPDMKEMFTQLVKVHEVLFPDETERERWQKPILRRLQMQWRENNVQSFEKLRQARRNFEQARTMLDALVKERGRMLDETLNKEKRRKEKLWREVSLEHMQWKCKNETELLKDSLALPGLPPLPTKAVSSDEEFVDSEDSDPRMRPSATQNLLFVDSQQGMGEGKMDGWQILLSPVNKIK